MTPAIIESPFAGDVTRNRAYLQRCIRWCLEQGLTPYASHQMLTEALDDTDPVQRAQGLAAGIAMSEHLHDAGAMWIWFGDHGISSGMEAARVAAEVVGAETRLVLLDRGSPPGVDSRGWHHIWYDGRW